MNQDMNWADGSNLGQEPSEPRNSKIGLKGQPTKFGGISLVTIAIDDPKKGMAVRPGAVKSLQVGELNGHGQRPLPPAPIGALRQGRDHWASRSL